MSLSIIPDYDPGAQNQSFFLIEIYASAES